MKVELNTFKPINSYNKNSVSEQKEINSNVTFGMKNINSEYFRANYMPIAFESDKIEEIDDNQGYSTSDRWIDPVDMDVKGPFDEGEDLNFFDMIAPYEAMLGIEPDSIDDVSIPYNINIEPDKNIPSKFNIIHDTGDVPATLTVANFKAPFVNFQDDVNVVRADFKNFQMNEVQGKNLHFWDSRFMPEDTEKQGHNSFKEGARFDNVEIEDGFNFINSSFSELVFNNCKAGALRMEKVPAAWDLKIKDSEFKQLDFLNVRFLSAPVFENVRLTNGVWNNEFNQSGSVIAYSFFEEGADLRGIDPNLLKNGFLFTCGYAQGTEDDFKLPDGVEFEDLLLFPEEMFFEEINPQFYDAKEEYEGYLAQLDDEQIDVPKEFKELESNFVPFVDDKGMKDGTEIVEETPREPVHTQAKEEEMKKLVSKYFYMNKQNKGVVTRMFPNDLNPNLRVN